MTKHFSKLKVLVFLYCFALAAALGYRPPKMEQVALAPAPRVEEITDSKGNTWTWAEPHSFGIVYKKGNTWRGTFTASEVTNQIYPNLDVTTQDHYFVINGNWIDIGFCHRDCFVYGSNDKGDQWSLTTKKKANEPRTH